MMKQEWEAYWDNYRYPDHFMQSEGEPFNNPVRMFIAGQSFGSVLDVGCASCISYPLFKEYMDKEYMGVDFTLQFLKSGKKKYPMVSVICGYALALPFKDGAFDTAFIKDVFEHMSPDSFRIVIAEMWRVVKHQIILAFYGNLNRTKVEMLREPDEHNVGVPPYKGGIYYFNAFSKEDVVETIVKLPDLRRFEIFDNIPRENCPEDKIGRTVVVVRKKNELP